MKSVIAAAAMSLVISDFANAEETRGKAMMKIEPSVISEADIRSVSPALARFGREAIIEDQLPSSTQAKVPSYSPLNTSGIA